MTTEILTPNSASEPSASMSAIGNERILILSDVASATQFISFMRPLEKLVFEGRIKLHIEPAQPSLLTPDGSRIIWDRYKPTIVILSRFTEISGIHMQNIANDQSVPVIFHIDDDLLAVPKSLGLSKYKIYNKPERLATLRDNLNNSDLVYASTSFLARVLSQREVTAPIVGGKIYCSVAPETITNPLPARDPVIGYMGTGGHAEDLEMILPVISRLMSEIPTLRFETFGTIPTILPFKIYGGRYTHHDPEQDYDTFIEKLSSLGWWVGLAPLLDNKFNKCKADTKWVEYSLAGIPVVATDINVYKNACAEDCGILADDHESWYNAINMLLRDPNKRNRMVARAQNKLRHSYTHSTLERQIAAIVQQARNYVSQTNT